MYDVIGDIHGYADELEELLKKIGYSRGSGGYRHPERQAVFLGDFIDRGPLQKGVINIVRPMIETGAALSVMGNHEFNAIAYFTPANDFGYLRKRNDRTTKQHAAFLREFENDRTAWTDVIEWFKSLPLWLELDEIRIIHACWDPKLILKIKEHQSGSALVGDDLLHKAMEPGTWQGMAIETLLKGKEIPLPNGVSFPDKEGTIRNHIRVRWWDNAKTFRGAYLGPENALTHIPKETISGDHVIDYRHDEKPVFLGHYWFTGRPKPLAPNIACVDYSVAKSGGKLVAYRWNGERVLVADNFVWVDRIT